jgi:hypothetical protein
VAIVFVAIEVEPDVTFAPDEPDLSENSLRKYLKRRQRSTQFGAIFLLAAALVGMDVGAGILFAELVDDPFAGIVVGATGAIGSLFTAYAVRDSLWPPSIRGKP